jgi:hypothetical protein
MLNPASLSPPDVTSVNISVSTEGVTLSGSITTKEPDRSLGRFFRTVHDAALQSRLGELRVDVRGLSFVNSSAIRLFIDWAIWVSQPGGPRYRLRFVRNPNVTWQRVSFPAIAQLAAAHVVIEDGA